MGSRRVDRGLYRGLTRLNSAAEIEYCPAYREPAGGLRELFISVSDSPRMARA